MLNQKPVYLDFTDGDLDFLVSIVLPGLSNALSVREAIRNDPAYRKAIVSDERVFFQVINDKESFLKISPSLYFEVLLRRAQKDLISSSYTIEREGRGNIPVFDTGKVAGFLDTPNMLEYLANMLASFTRIRSFVVPVRVRKGIRRRVRYNDMDVDSLIDFAARADESERFSYYKRIGDVCLFLTGLFRDSTYSQKSHVGSNFQSGTYPRTTFVRKRRRSVEEYESEGRRFYRLAEEHPTASVLELTDVFSVLRDEFSAARKPLAFLSARYLHSRPNKLFDVAYSA
ncbi:hypothetical protein FIM05_00270 [SAR202 cluster bacterium AD-802-K11_MRT_200m]|nr:hypothetical protein [SAR202 cluster bacterium AD-802-K11_MRT_200m]